MRLRVFWEGRARHIVYRKTRELGRENGARTPLLNFQEKTLSSSAVIENRVHDNSTSVGGCAGDFDSSHAITAV